LDQRTSVKWGGGLQAFGVLRAVRDWSSTTLNTSHFTDEISICENNIWKQSGAPDHYGKLSSISLPLTRPCLGLQIPIWYISKCACCLILLRLLDYLGSQGHIPGLNYLMIMSVVLDLNCVAFLATSSNFLFCTLL
jgi:hypothetical protein